jgi:hypothetical protein
MQHRPMPSPTPLPSLASFDDEFEGTTQVGPERNFQPTRLYGLYAGLLIASVILAATSVMSTTPQFWSLVQALASSPTDSQTRVSTVTPDLFTEMDVLKRELSELRELQQQISARVANLHLDQQELRPSLIKTGSWYSEPNVLQQGLAPKPRVVHHPRAVSARPRPALEQANAESSQGNESSSSIASQTTTSDILQSKEPRSIKPW